MCDLFRAVDGCVLKVEVLSENNQNFDGEKFYRYGAQKYFVKPKRKPTAYLHRAVWIRHHGDIPDGYHVHHKDGDRANNQIENLELLTPKEHIHHHFDKDPVGRAEKRDKGLELAREAARDWHKSEEGLEWHRMRGEAMSGPKPRTVPCTCQYCGTAFMATRTAIFCSKNCKVRTRYHSKKDHETRICKGCGGQFEASRFTKTQCCSRECSGQVRSQIYQAGVNAMKA